MNRQILAIVIVLLSSQLYAQKNPLAAFDRLIGYSWVSEGMQLGGFEGKTVYEFRWGVNQKIVHVKTFTTDPETRAFGLRNEGIRAFNLEKNRLEFYEFDKLGGITKGVLLLEGNNFYYDYEYQGLQLRDSWTYLSENKYKFTVGSWDGKSWTKKFHEGLLTRTDL